MSAPTTVATLADLTSAHVGRYVRLTRANSGSPNYELVGMLIEIGHSGEKGPLIATLRVRWFDGHVIELREFADSPVTVLPDGDCEPPPVARRADGSVLERPVRAPLVPPHQATALRATPHRPPGHQFGDGDDGPSRRSSRPTGRLGCALLR